MHLPARSHILHWGSFALVAMICAAAVAYVLMPKSVTVVRPVYGPSVEAVYATGTVEPSVMMPIAPRVGARLIELEVDEGAEVKKGQVLAKLEATDLENALHQLEAQEAFATRDYRRYSAMIKQGIVAQQAYDKAKSDWQAAVAATARARAEAGFMTLTALDDGRIIKRDGEIGELIAANQPLFWLSGHSAIRISADVDEEDVAEVRPGQEVLIRADGFPGRIFHGRVQTITPKGDPVARSYRVRIGFSEASPLMIGMTAETNIIVSQRQHALLVPAAAVVAGKVWLIRNGRLEIRSVSAGTKGSSATEILAGLSPYDAVVEAPDASLHAGDRAHAVVAEFAP